MLNIEAINERFVGLSKAILKRRNLFLVLMVLVLAFSVYGPEAVEDRHGRLPLL